MVTFALSFAETPRILQEAMLRKPRRRPRAHPAANFADNNYLAEAHVEGGRNTSKSLRMQEDRGHSGDSNSTLEENGGSPSDFCDNNYLAESHAPNWGRNRKGAGAPRGNRNAWLQGLTRTGMALLRLRQRNRIQRLQMLVLCAEIEQADRLSAQRGARRFHPRNARAMAPHIGLRPS